VKTVHRTWAAERAKRRSRGQTLPSPFQQVDDNERRSHADMPSVGRLARNKSNAIDAATAAQALADHAGTVAVALLGEPSSQSGDEMRWGRHGSVALRLSGRKKGLWYDFERGEGGDVLDLIAREHGVGLGEAICIAERDHLGGAGIRLDAARLHPGSPAPLANDAVARIEAALRIWRETEPIVGTLAEHYFVEQRKLDVRPLALDHALRWHAGIRAVVALMTDPVTGKPVGIHRTFLDADGSKIERKMLGRTGVVRLSPEDAVTMGLGVTEGIKDGLAILLSGWAPVWAATSAGAIARFPVLAGIEALTIFADVDEPGIQVADACAARWRANGQGVRVSYPREVAHV
jgi:putative DNA primase/helicase